MKKFKTDIIVLIILAFVGVLYANLTKELYIGKATIAGAVYIIPSVIYL